MKVRIIIEYEPDVDHENISDEEARAVAKKELEGWKTGDVFIQDFAFGHEVDCWNDNGFAINVEWNK